MSTGAFMKISSQKGAKLLAASSDAAGIAELHEMKMDGDIMRMRAVESLRVAPGQTIELRSGSYHLMLMDLKRQLNAGDEVAISITYENHLGKPGKLKIKARAAMTAPIR